MNTQPTTNPTTPTLAEIAAAQATTNIFAFDRAAPARELARLQKLYAHRLAQLDTLAFLFDEGAPELTIGGETQQLTLRLGTAVNDVYPALREAVENALSQLERDIVAAHQKVAQWAHDVARDYADKPDYTPAILALCEPAAPLAVRLAPAQPTAHALAA